MIYFADFSVETHSVIHSVVIWWRHLLPTQIRTFWPNRLSADCVTFPPSEVSLTGTRVSFLILPLAPTNLMPPFEVLVSQQQNGRFKHLNDLGSLTQYERVEGPERLMVTGRYHHSHFYSMQFRHFSCSLFDTFNFALKLRPIPFFVPQKLYINRNFFFLSQQQVCAFTCLLPYTGRSLKNLNLQASLAHLHFNGFFPKKGKKKPNL